MIKKQYSKADLPKQKVNKYIHWSKLRGSGEDNKLSEE